MSETPRGPLARTGASFGDDDLATITVLIADDDPSQRHFLHALLGLKDDFHIVGNAYDANGALAVAATHKPSVALVDMHMPGGGLEAIRGVLQVSPETRVVALSGDDDSATIVEAIGAGATGYLIKGVTGEEIVETLRLAAEGKSNRATELSAAVLTSVGQKLRADSQRTTREREMTHLIRRLLQPGAIRPVFQPIVDLTSGSVVGVEALSRFPSDAPSPQQCFEGALEVGLALDLEVACLDAALSFIDQLPSGISLAINVSPETIVSREFYERLRPLGPQAVVELTEHAVVEDYDELADMIGWLRKSDVRFAVDDAGAGFASLRHILRLNPDIIKLDIQLTTGIDSDGARQALASAMVAFATGVGAAIIAEGIETQRELEKLVELGVKFGQGFYLAHPAPVTRIAEEIESFPTLH
jgi:EAL domain-containing protein (putative c-di-GMP-specific phosphodiesterase class I)/CheY-like chemotaxis protein